MDDLLFYNVIPVMPGQEDFTISEILRQNREVGLTRFLLCLSFHPQTKRAADLIPVLCKRFATVRDGIAGHNIELSVLVQSTLGHGWVKKGSPTDENWQTIVGSNGGLTRMCPLDAGFRQYIKDAMVALAKEGPSFLLFDDDFGLRAGECLCPLHLEKINGTLNSNYSREELEALLKKLPGTDPLVESVSDILKASIVDFAKEVRAAIDTVNPDIRCGICACYGGHAQLNDLAWAFAGKNKPIFRVNNATYGNSSAFSLIPSFRMTSRIIYQTDGITDILDESDTFPQTCLGESAAMFHSHISTAMLSGINGCKLWMSEFEQPVHYGSQARFEEKIRTYRGFYAALYGISKEVSWSGVSGLAYRASRGVAGNPVNPFKSLYNGSGGHDIEGLYALPLRYEGVEKEGVSLLHGGDDQNLTDEQIRELLSHAVVVDSIAARNLSARGFSELLGVNADSGDEDFNFSSDISVDGEVNSAYRWLNTSSRLVPISDEVEVISNFCTGDRFSSPKVVAPSITFYKNKLGGRIAVLGWPSELTYDQFYRLHRRNLLLKALDCVNGSPLEMAVETWQQSIVRHGILKDGREILAVTQVGLDQFDALPIRMARTPKLVERLLPDGSWESVDFSRGGPLLVNVAVHISPCDPVVLRFTF